MARNDVPEALRPLYFPRTGPPTLVKIPELRFLMIDGKGAPGDSTEFSEAVQALYGTAYTIKFAARRAGRAAAPVMPLEGLFWTARGQPLSAGNRSRWRWTLLLLAPFSVEPRAVSDAIRDLATRRPSPALGRLRLEKWKEGAAAQVLHIGPYAAEAPTIRSLVEFIRSHGYRPAGKHHEIYLSDPRRTAPDRLKTVIRLAIARNPGAPARSPSHPTR